MPSAPSRSALSQSAPELMPVIARRQDWTEADPTGPLDSEDVRFLIVHHTASSTEHEPEDVPGILRGIRSFHIESRGWDDIAYNFLIDRHGVIWEGRAGSLEGPVAGDATGGNQGFTQLVCLIGDFTTEPPTEAAQQSLIATLAWLAAKYEVNVEAGTTVSFVSRGSNRWPGGTEVTTTPISGHRDMSLTSCPGDAFYPMLSDVVSPAVRGVLAAVTSTTYPSTTTTSQPSTTASTTLTSTNTSTILVLPSTTVVAAEPVESPAGGLWWSLPVVAGGLLAALVTWRMRRMSRP